MMRHAWRIPRLIPAAVLALTAGLLPARAAAPLGWEDSGPERAKAGQDQDISALSLEELKSLKVASASLHEESLKDAPASVTVITGEEIRKFGYRTLGEVLSHARGFYTSWDGSYTYLGVRGFSLPGDYDTRTLILINGHKTTESIFGGNPGLGQDFPLDMSMVGKIEIVRGPASALYGSNGVFATINVITRRPEESGRATLQMETGSFGEKKIQASTSVELPRNANLLLSLSVFNNSGEESLYLPELDAPETNFGRAVRMEGEKGFHLFGDLTWNNWELLFVQGDRVQIQPISWGPTLFNDRGTRAEESRGFIDLSYTRHFDRERVFRWRTSYDYYRYRGIYHRPSEVGEEDDRERDYADWLTSEVTYRFPALGPGALTVGGEAKIDLRSMQNAFTVQPVKLKLLDLDKRDKYAALFVQQEWTLGSRWRLDLGLRFDTSTYRPSSASPRAALIYQPSAKTALKFLAGRAFRNPSAYEMFFDDGGLSAIGNPALKPEKVNSYEVVYERECNRNWRTSVSAYRYSLSGVISGVLTSNDIWQYVNTDHVTASGIEAEISGRLFSSLDVLSSFAIQRAVSHDRQALANSPGQVGKLRLSLPVSNRRFTLSSGLQYMGRRQTNAGLSVAPALVPELTFSSTKLIHRLSFTFGLRNFLDHPYRDPIALSGTVDSITRSGRTWFLSAVWHGIE